MSNLVFFDGVDDYVTCGTNVAAFKMASGSFSICARVKVQIVPPTSGEKVALFGVQVGGGTSRYMLGMHVASRGFGWSLKDDAGNILETYSLGGDCMDNTWHHFTVVFNRTTNFAYSYKDGVLANSGNIAAIVGTVNPVGASVIDSGVFGVAAPTRELMAEVQLYSRALSDTEVLYNVMHPNNPIKRGIALNLTQDSIQGAQWLDLSGNNNHGTYTSGAVPVTANLLAGR